MGRTVSHTSWSACPHTLPSTGAYWRSDDIKLLKVFLVAMWTNYLYIYIWYKKVLGTKYCLAVELTRLCFSLGPCDSTLPASCPDWILGWTKKNRSHNGKYLKILIPSHTCAEKSHQVYHSSASCTSCTLFVARLWCILWSYSGIAECPQDLVILAFNCLGALTTIRCFSLAC